MGISAGDLAGLVIGVSFAAGLNVYATLLTLGGLSRMGWVQLPGGMEVVGSWWVIGISAGLFLVEFVADKIPAFDLVWNAAQTFVRVPVAGLLAYGATSHLRPEMQVLVTVLGAVVAALAHGSKLAVRGLVTPSPEPVSNIALSSMEDVGAIGLTWVAVHHPYVAAGVVGGLVLVAGVMVRSLVVWGRRMWERRRGDVVPAR
ncbi:DUF4126 domain-containing protein [Granulicella tundricola]|uniref:Transmembrane protein n=1 Tax=Granulicella tundricola (strain ATCC BAA-1859 / DSM 23138 / MP5ACTX9) TaxID=1198114 RepID=E8X4H2_GRATM|nr:DUF4126 domain-containing protein [Granulicella tundricola]ADW68299.1 transmembrane protein [Granulicella tundricola MP5ACTX9]